MGRNLLNCSKVQSGFTSFLSKQAQITVYHLFFWAKSGVVVAEVTNHYLPLCGHCGHCMWLVWPLQTILDTLLKRPQLLANLQNGPSRKHFIRRCRILIAINAINVEETQPHCVRTFSKKGRTSQHFQIFVHRA